MRQATSVVEVVSIALLLVIESSGCSFIGVRSPPVADAGVRPVSCSTSVALPVVDTVPALLLAGVAVATFVSIQLHPLESTGGDPEPDGRGYLVVFPALASVPFAISAAYGFSATSRCRELNRPR